MRGDRSCCGGNVPFGCLGAAIIIVIFSLGAARRNKNIILGTYLNPLAKTGNLIRQKKKKKETREEKNLDKNSPSENPHFKLYAGDLGCPDRSFPVTLMLFPLS